MAETPFFRVPERMLRQAQLSALRVAAEWATVFPFAGEIRQALGRRTAV